MGFRTDLISDELVARRQWICWAEEERDGNLTKTPKQPDGSGENARSNDMQTWGDFEEAVEAAQERDGWGIGFVFSDAGPYVGIDLDGCLKPSDDDRGPAPEDWLPPLDAFDDCYIEVSPSGGGLHIIVKETRIPDWWTNQIKRRDKNPAFFENEVDVVGDHEEIGVELYDSGRFFTFTGETLDDFGGDNPCESPELAEWLTAAYLVFNDSLPDLPGESSDHDGDWSLNVYDVLSRSQYPEGKRCAHPVHGSTTGANFMVDPGGETWRCWSGDHACTGDALHLVGMEEGLIDCGEWVHGSIDSDTWAEVFDTARDRGLIEDDRDADEGSSERPIPPDIDQEPDRVWQEIQDGYYEARDADEKQMIRHRASRFLQSQRAFAAHEESDTLFVYNPTNGVYEPRGEAHIKRTLVRRLNHHYTRHENNEITDQLRGLSYRRPEAFGGPEGKINLSNGVLELDEMELRDHDPEHMFLSSMPVEYDSAAEAPLWEEFLAEVVPRQIDRMKIQEYVGYCLMHWNLTFHKALFIVGPTASGKSTFLDTVRSLLGPDTVSSVTPQELVDERFAAVELFGAWANIRNDIPSGVIENTGKFKELVAGDPIKAERKYEPTFTFQPKAKHLYSANQLPEASVDDDAFYRRIMLISFPSTIPINDRDPELPSKLADELSGILNWAIEGYHRLQDNDEFTGARSPAEIRDTWEAWGSTVERFKQDALVYEPDGAVPKSLAHNAYVAFCEDQGLPAAETQNQLTRKLTQDKDIQQGRRSVNNSRQRCYLGVALKEEWDPRLQGDDRSEHIPDQALDEFGTET